MSVVFVVVVVVVVCLAYCVYEASTSSIIDLFFIRQNIQFCGMDGGISGGGSPELDGFYLTKLVDLIVFLVSFLRLS